MTAVRSHLSRALMGAVGLFVLPTLQRLGYRKGTGCARQGKAFPLRAAGCHVSGKASAAAGHCHAQQLGGLSSTTW